MPSEDRQRLEEERRLEQERQEEARRQQGPRMFPEGEGQVRGEIPERRPFEEQPATIPQVHPAEGEEVRIHVEVARPGEAPSEVPAIIVAPSETTVLPAGLPTEEMIRGQPELPIAVQPAVITIPRAEEAPILAPAAPVAPGLPVSRVPAEEMIRRLPQQSVTVQPAAGAEGEEVRIHVELPRPREVAPGIITAPSESPFISSVAPGLPVAGIPTEDMIRGQPELPATIQPAPTVITAPGAVGTPFFAQAAPVAPGLPVTGVPAEEIVRGQPQMPISVQPAPTIMYAPETAPAVHEVTASIPAAVPSEIQTQPAILPVPGLPKVEEQRTIVVTVPHEAAVGPEVIQPLLPPVETVGVPVSRGQPTPVEFPEVIKLAQPSEPTRTGKKLELPTAAPEPVPPVERQPTEVPEWKPEATGEQSEVPSVVEQQGRPPFEEAPEMEAPGTGERRPEVTGVPEGQPQPPKMEAPGTGEQQSEVTGVPEGQPQPVEAPRSEAPQSLDVEALLEKERGRVEPPRQQESVPELEPGQLPREPLMQPTVPAPVALPEEQRFEIYGAGAEHPNVEVIVRPSAGLVVPQINVQPGGYEAPTQFNVPIVPTEGREPLTFYPKEEMEPAAQLPVAPSAAALPVIEPEPARPRVLGVPPTGAVPRLEPRMLPGQTIVSEPLPTAVPEMQPQWLPRQPIVSVPPTAAVPGLEPQILQGQPSIVSVPAAAAVPGLEPQILQGQPSIVSVPPTAALPRLEPRMLPRPTIVAAVPELEPQILLGQPHIMRVPPTVPRLGAQILQEQPAIVSIPTMAAVPRLEPQILLGQPTIVSVPPTTRLQPQILPEPTIVSVPPTAAVPVLEPQILQGQPTIVSVSPIVAVPRLQPQMLPRPTIVSGPLTAAVPGIEPQWRALPGARFLQPPGVAPPCETFREVTEYPQGPEVAPPPVPAITSGLTRLSDVELLVPLTGDVYIDDDNIPSDSEDLPVIGQLSAGENVELGKTGLSYPYKFKDFRSYYFRPTSALNQDEKKE